MNNFLKHFELYLIPSPTLVHMNGWKIGAFLVWAGLGLELGVGESPFREFLFAERWMGPVLSTLGITWGEWINSTMADGFASKLEWGMAILFWLSAAGVLWRPHWKGWLVTGGMTLLYLGARAYASAYPWLEFAEGLLWLGAASIGLGIAKRTQASFFSIAAALVFLSHGIIALGWVDRPGRWGDMVSSVLGLGPQGVDGFLIGIGVLDVLAAVLVVWGLFARQLKPWTWGLWWMFFWGTLTALTRVSSHLGMDTDVQWVQWLAQTLYRLPNGLIPGLMLWQLAGEIRLQKP